MELEQKFLHKIAEFTNIALKEIGTLEGQVSYLRKQATVSQIEKERFQLVLEKAADALYNTDYITDSYAKKDFIKKALADNSYVARVLIKVCDAAEVAQIGAPARVTRVKPAEYDPVMAKAFGTSKYSSILED